MDMDYILEKGDELYKSLNVHIPLNIDELPQHVNIEGCLPRVRLLSQQQGNISNNVINDFLNVSYQETLNTGNGLLFFINGYTLALVWTNKDSSYLILIVDLLRALYLWMVIQF